MVLGLLLNEKDEVNVNCEKNETLYIDLLKFSSLCAWFFYLFHKEQQ